MQSAPAPEIPAVSNATSIDAPSGRRVLLFSLIAILAGIGTTLWLESIKYERYSSYLQARLRTITAGREARVAQILVNPGAVVAAGQPILVLEDRSFEDRIQSRRHEIESLEIELARTEAALEVELDIQQRDILDRIFDTKCRSAQLLRQQFLTPGESALSSQIAGRGNNGLRPVVPLVDRSSLIFDDAGRVEQASLQQRKSAEVDGLTRATLIELELCTQHIANLEKLGRDLPEKIGRSMGVHMVQARLAHSKLALARLEREQKDLTIVAEAPGMIGTFHKQAGDAVSAHEPIVQLLDEEQPYLVLQFPSPRISDFAPGTEVELRFPNGRKGKGRVEEIPPQTSAIPEEGTARTETTITAHIDPIGALWPSLPFGSVVEVRRPR